ncbi:MAG: hypothetical protein IT203_03560 [Fimbriimonadaceae bacterium]|nr:hypothetical protein [Fimbriimonadaceae bacterium]
MLSLLRFAFSIPLVILAFSFQTESPTYGDSIRPILAKKCAACHYEGGSAPFPLQTYAQTKKRGDLVRLVSLTGQMPPTDATSDLGELTPHLALTPPELKVVQDWYRAGMPEGPKTPEILADLTSSGETTFDRFVAVGQGQSFPAEGRWARAVYALPSLGIRNLSGFTFKPLAPKAVRQAALAIQRKGEPIPFTSTGIRPGTLVATWAPGYYTWGASKACFPLETGDKLWLQVRAVPTGKVELAGGLIGFKSLGAGNLIKTKTLGTKDISIPAEAQIHLRDEWTLEEDIDLLSIFPESRFTTEQVRATAIENGQEKLLLVVLTWDAVWPGAYNFKNAVHLRKGTKIVWEALINNSRHGHFADGGKTKNVGFGPYSDNEIFWCHLQYVSRKP